MKAVKKLTCLSLFLIILLFPYYAEATRGIAIRPVSPAGREVKGDQWLFVIGIDTYIHWPHLKTAVNDAKAVKNVLLARYHFDKKHLIELYNDAATEKNIIGKFRYLARNMRENDSLVIFYAGHGHIDSITKSGSWIPVESGESEASAWVSNHDIKNYLKIDAIKAKHILLISDSCFSGDFFRGRRGKLPEVTDKTIKKSYALTSRQAITSGGLEPVSDAGFGGNSVFSCFLVRALKENQKPFLVPSDFFPRIKAGVAENAEQFPRFGTLKDTGGSQGGEIILFLKQDTRLKGLSKSAAERQKELDRLRALEKADRVAKKKEAAEIAKRKEELSKLDKQITDMKRRLGTSAVYKDDSLNTMLVMVRKKEAQQKRIDELKRKRKAEEAKRQSEILRLKKEQIKKRITALKKDIKKYKEIVSSRFGKGMKTAAWKSLIAKYPDAGKGLKPGDIEKLKFRVKYSGVKKQITNSIGMKFVLIPNGTFMMGSPSSEPKRESDKRQHSVTISRPFYLQTTEVTQAQWKVIMGSNPSNFKGDSLPVETVSWNNVKAFIRKLNRREGTDKYRLPTEAEWEYACRAGTTTPFYTGGCISTDQANHNGNYPMPGCSKGRDRKETVSVASFSSNGWGCTTCTATSMSGARTGTRKIIRQAMLPTREGRHQDRPVSFAGAPGAITRGAVDPRVASGSILTSGTTM